MPVEIEVYQKELPAEIVEDLQRIYIDTPGYADAQLVLDDLQSRLAQGDRYYAGRFNGHYICGALVSSEGSDRRMRYLAVHPATRGRGVAERLVDAIRQQELERGPGYLLTGFNVDDEQLATILKAMGFIPHGEARVYRCQL